MLDSLFDYLQDLLPRIYGILSGANHCGDSTHVLHNIELIIFVLAAIFVSVIFILLKGETKTRIAVVALSVIIALAWWWTIDGNCYSGRENIVFSTLLCASICISVGLVKFLHKKLKQFYIRQKELSVISKGEWKFPKIEFYDDCVRLGIDPKAGPITKKKFSQTANKILEKYIPKKYWSLYPLNDELIANYYYEGKIEKDEKAKALKREQKEKDRKEKTSVFNGTLPSYLSQDINLHKKWSTLVGTEKRKEMLKHEVSNARSALSAAKSSLRSKKQLQDDIVMNRFEKKPNDWAVLGGIADGLAGPGAGAAVALQAMAENQKIEAENKKIRENKLIYYQASETLVKEAENFIENAEMNLHHLEYQLEKVDDLIVVDDIDINELFESLSIECKVKVCDEYLYVSTSVKNSYKTDPSEKIEFVTDGALSAKIYNGDTFIDEVTIVFPTNGVPCNGAKSSLVTAYSSKYMKNKNKYTVTISPINLWLMEK